MNKNKQKELLSKWVNVAQMLEGKDKNTYIVLKPTNELPDVKPMNGPIDLAWNVYPNHIEKPKGTELGCSYPDCICQGDEITYCNNRTPEQVVLGDKTALVEDIFHQELKPSTYSIPIYENGIKTEWTVDGIVGDEKYFKLLEFGNGKDLPDMINTNTKKK